MPSDLLCHLHVYAHMSSRFRNVWSEPTNKRTNEETTQQCNAQPPVCRFRNVWSEPTNKRTNEETTQQCNAQPPVCQKNVAQTLRERCLTQLPPNFTGIAVSQNRQILNGSCVRIQRTPTIKGCSCHKKEGFGM